MSKELKTLNEIEQFEFEGSYNIYSSYNGDKACFEYVKIKDLRQEAIKWIKELEEINISYFCGDEIELNKIKQKYKVTDYGVYIKDVFFNNWEEASDIDGAINILKIIFNITEEDLK